MLRNLNGSNANSIGNVEPKRRTDHRHIVRRVQRQGDGAEQAEEGRDTVG